MKNTKTLKYVKLFEQWVSSNGHLRLNEKDENEISAFDVSRITEWPVIETTIKDLYSDSGSISMNVLQSVIGRAVSAFKSKEWTKKVKQSNAKIEQADVDISGGTFGITGGVKNDRVRGMIETKDLKPLAQKSKEFSKYFRDGFRSVDFTKNLTAIYSISGLPDAFCIFPKDKPKSVSDNDNCMYLPCIVGIPGEEDATYVTSLGFYVLFLATRKAEPMLANDDSVLKSKLMDNVLAQEPKGVIKYNYASAPIEPTDDMKLKAVEFDPNSGQPGLYAFTLEGSGFLGQVDFEFNKADLKPNAKQVLVSDNVKQVFLSAKKSIEVVGHADGAGSDAVNQPLSENRAKNVLEFIKKLDWFKDVKVKVTSKGMSSKEPIIDDDKGKNDLAAAFNRRVEIVVDGAPKDYSNMKKTYEKIKAVE